jgi:hypothetical protein
MSDSTSKIEKRFPAKGIKACLIPSYNFETGKRDAYYARIYDEDYDFKDYLLTHDDMEIEILDDYAEFIETEDGGMYLDYSLEALRGE